MVRKLERFEMRHTLRGGNKEADQLANEAMDRGMGKGSSGVGGVSGASRVSAPAPRPVPQPAASKPARQVLEGYVKDGVVHLLEGELPDGIFVKVVRE
jgi:probable phosphoglycerate mutase